jgi:hypothetical protein
MTVTVRTKGPPPPKTTQAAIEAFVAAWAPSCWMKRRHFVDQLRRLLEAYELHCREDDPPGGPR